jgi:CBS domain-containing protein
MAHYLVRQDGFSHNETDALAGWAKPTQETLSPNMNDTTTAQQVLAGKTSPTIITTRADTTVQDACKLMRQHRIGCLLVTDADGHIEGIFSERDVVDRLVAEDKDASDTKVGEIMTRDVIVVEPHRTLSELEAIMRQNRIRHLPVAGPNALLGLLSIGDVMAHHAATNQQMVHHLTEYIYGRH